MPQKNKLKTPEWILEGYDSEEEYNKAKGLVKKEKSRKTFKLKKCPRCNSDDVGIVITGEEGKGSEWECHKCKWKGRNIDEKELTEEEFIRHFDNEGEEI